MSVKKSNSPQCKFDSQKSRGVAPNLARANWEKGVIDRLLHSYGFIKCLDRKNSLFFHYSDYNSNIDTMKVGDPVEFSISSYKHTGKRIAVQVTGIDVKQAVPTMVSDKEVIGAVIHKPKPVKNKNLAYLQETLPNALDGLGRVLYEHCGEFFSLPFAQDVIDPHTKLKTGDQVIFHLEPDPQTGGICARSLHLVNQRYQGVICSMKCSFGFIERAEVVREIFFHYSEFKGDIDELCMGHDVEFSIQMRDKKQVAVEIERLPDGTVVFKDLTMEEDEVPHYGDKVEFETGEQKTKRKITKKVAANTKELFRRSTSHCQGYVATLKDKYGFIENKNHQEEVFFHFSAFNGNANNDLDLGDEVEYTLARRSNKVIAENIRKLPKGTVGPREEIVYSKGTVQGKIVRPLRIVNPEQDEYCGLVQAGLEVEEGETAVTYPYSITSLADKRDFLQKDDIVSFQVAKVKGIDELRAINMAAQRTIVRAKVDSVNGQFGFLNYEVGGKNLFFHMMEVHDSAQISAGDQVEFVVVQIQRNSKYSACSVRKITERPRPERLISRLKSVTDDTAPRLVVDCPPRGPDGTRGFTTPRTLWKPAS